MRGPGAWLVGAIALAACGEAARDGGGGSSWTRLIPAEAVPSERATARGVSEAPALAAAPGSAEGAGLAEPPVGRAKPTAGLAEPTADALPETVDPARALAARVAQARDAIGPAEEELAPSCPASCRWGCSDAGRCEDVTWTVVGDAHSCALRDGGTVDCWGANDRGQLGDGTTRTRARPAPVRGVDGAIAIAAGAAHTCVVERTGVTCWGANDRGQLGDGTLRDRTTPLGLALDAEVVDVAAGGARSCVLTSEGEVLCWGAGATSPAPLEGLGPASAIAVGGAHACAVGEDGRVWCWGANDDGQLGDGTREPSDVPVRAGDLEEIVRVHAGRAHTCAIDARASAVCWGDNDRGQLGDGTLADHPTPDVRHASVIAVGGDRTCGRVPFGEVACWGEGYGALGARVPLLDEASIVAIGPAHGCAAHRIGTARCWGENGAGQLGDGTLARSDEPRDALPPGP